MSLRRSRAWENRLSTLSSSSYSDFGALCNALGRLLLIRGATLLQKVAATADDAALLNIFEYLSTFNCSCRNSTRCRSCLDLRKPDIHRVTALDKPAYTVEGYLIRSTTSAAMSPHTDEYLCEHPAHFVLLQCCAQSMSGGQTTLAYIDEVVERMDSAAIAELSSPLFPTGSGFTRILSRNSHGWNVQYNHEALHEACRIRGYQLNAAQLASLRQLDESIAKSLIEIQLNNEDILALNNHKTLHGRNAFASDSGRLIKRVRVHSCTEATHHCGARGP